MKHEWNSHFIRQSRHCTVPGIPDEVYYLPHTHGFDHCRLTLSADDKENVLDRREVYNEAEIADEIDDERHDFASYKVIRIPESSNFCPWNPVYRTLKSTIQILDWRIPLKNESSQETIYSFSHSFSSVIKVWLLKASACHKGVREPCWFQAYLIFPHLIYLEFQWLEKFP